MLPHIASIAGLEAVAQYDPAISHSICLPTHRLHMPYCDDHTVRQIRALPVSGAQERNDRNDHDSNVQVWALMAGLRVAIASQSAALATSYWRLKQYSQGLYG
jgi:hypothetical protein